MFLANAWDKTSNWFLDWFYDKNFIQIGSFSVAKYAVCILTGIILAYFICTKEGKKLGIDKNIVINEMIWIVPCCILGARIWYLVGDGDNTFKSFLDSGSNFFEASFKMIGYIFGFRNGSFVGIQGLAIHGGIALAIPLALIAAKKNHYSILSVFDMLAPGLLIGQICGRWGNFFNQEAYGIVVGGWTTDGRFLVPLKTLAEQYDILTKDYMILPFIAKNMLIEGGNEYYYGIINGVQTYGFLVSDAFMQPTFLYESLLNFVALILYFILRRRKFVRSGYFLSFYLIWYGIVRFFIEAIRCDSLYLGSITFLKMAQLTSILMVLAGIALIILIRFVFKTKRYVDIIEENKQKE